MTKVEKIIKRFENQVQITEGIVPYNARKLIKYIRKLEGENKRLKEELDSKWVEPVRGPF